MTIIERNIAIARKLGWTEIREDYFRDDLSTWTEWCGTNPAGDRKPIPNYCCDLNAMREAELALGHFERWYYVTQLKGRDRFELITAPAMERAIAFLK